MLVRRSNQVDKKPMDIPGASGVNMRLLVGREDGAPNFSMRLFEVDPGGSTPHHQHNYEHEIIVLEGSGEVQGNDTTRPIGSGDAIFMPANKMHQLRNTGDAVMKFICVVPTTHDCGDGDGCSVTPGS